MESKFKLRIRVKGRPNTDDEGKIGRIIEKGRWINSRAKPVKPPADIWFVLWEGETDKKLKREDDLEIIE